METGPVATESHREEPEPLREVPLLGGALVFIARPGGSVELGVAVEGGGHQFLGLTREDFAFAMRTGIAFVETLPERIECAVAEPKPDLQEVDGDGPCPRCKGTQQDIPESDVTIRHCQGCDTTWRVRLRLKARPPS